MSRSERIRYRLPPLERRGVIAGWRGGQVATVAGSLVVAVATVRGRPTLLGVMLAVMVVAGGIAVAFWPIRGRTGDQWLPVVFRWLLAGVQGGHRAYRPDLRPGHPPPPATDALAVIDLEVGPGRAIGAVVDGGSDTMTAVLAIGGESFALLSPADQDARVALWARVLAAPARQGSAVHRLQWIEACRADDGRAVTEHLATHRALPADSAAVRSYEALLGEVAPVTRLHHVHVAVTIHRRRSARAIRRHGGGLAGAGTVLAGELESVVRALTAANLEVGGVLNRAALSDLLATSLGAGSRAGTRAAGTSTGVSTAAGRHDDPWPSAMETGWGAVRTDSAWHAVYWVAEWPRVDVSPEFLGPLLFAPLTRTLSVVMEPVDPLRAARQVAHARTADTADAELRRRGGFLTTARQHRERQGVDARDSELADGHAQLRYTGYVGVSATDEAGLEAACAALEQAAGQARLEVKRLYGQQDAALLCLLPVGRGLT